MVKNMATKKYIEVQMQECKNKVTDIYIEKARLDVKESELRKKFNTLEEILDSIKDDEAKNPVEGKQND